MDRAALNELFDFTDFTWASYGNAVRALPPEALTRPVDGSGWPALRDPLFHIAAGWDDWLRDRLGETTPLDESPSAVGSWDGLQRVRDRTRGWLRRVIDETSDADLLAPSVPLRPPSTDRVAPAEVLAHILLHERGHHGDITTLIAALGGTPAMVDYLVYRWFKRHAKS